MTTAAPDRQRLLAAHAAANDFYRSRLPDELPALGYLRSRGIVGATAHSAPWTIGYAPAGWTALRDHLRSGFTDAELLAAGLVTTARSGNIIDVFRNRVMFPIRNPDGHVVAFTGRDLSDGRPEAGRATPPKYRNTATTAIYSKKHILYGMAEQLGGDIQPDAVMLVEGPADVVAVARLRQSIVEAGSSGPLVAVAPCGTALTLEQVTLLAATVPPGTSIVVAFDADTAGCAAADKAYQLLQDWPGPVEAIALPAGADPASLVAASRTDAATLFRTTRTPLAEMVLDQRLEPHLARLDARLRELEHLGRDPALEAMQLKVAAVHSVQGLIAGTAAQDPELAARLAHHLTVRLDLEPLTVLETIYPPDDGTASVAEQAAPAASAEPMEPATTRGPAIPLGTAGYPDPTAVGHQYARTEPTPAAATWVEHDPSTGHTAWVITEGVGDNPADREAAQLAAEVAGRVAPVVGAYQAVVIARTAVNAHFANAEVQGDATISVLTSFDGDTPAPGVGRFTVAWAGDARAYAITRPGSVRTDGTAAPAWLHDGRWFAPITVDHVRSVDHDAAEQRRIDVGRYLAGLVQQPIRELSTAERQAFDRAATAGGLEGSDPQHLVGLWHTARRWEQHLPRAGAVANAAEQRLRMLFPDVMHRYDNAVAQGTGRVDALRVAAADLAEPPHRPGDRALTASVRSGYIGVNRLDLPVSGVLLIGRAVRAAAEEQICDALTQRSPQAAVGQIRRLGGGGVAVVVHPSSDRSCDRPTAVRLASLDQAATTGLSRPAPPSGQARRPVLSLGWAAPVAGR